MVNNAISFRLFCVHVVIPIGIFFDLLDGFSSVAGDDLVQGLAPADDLLGRDADVRGLSTRTAGRLVNHDSTVGQNETLPLGPCGEENRRHAGGHADAVGHHIAGEEVDGIIDGHASSDHATGGVNVQMDILFGILHLQVKELRDHHIGNVIVDSGANEDDAVLEQAGINIHRPLTPTGILNDVGNVVAAHVIVGRRWLQAFAGTVVTVALETRKSTVLSKMMLR